MPHHLMEMIRIRLQRAELKDVSKTLEKACSRQTCQTFVTEIQNSDQFYWRDWPITSEMR